MNSEYDNSRHRAPVFHDDAIFAELEVLSEVEREARDHLGRGTTESPAYDQNDDIVLSGLVDDGSQPTHAEPSPELPPDWQE